MMIWAFLLVSLIFNDTTVLATPTGAGGCAGQGSVGGTHLGGTVITGSIADFGAIINFGAVEQLQVGVITNFTVNNFHTIVITHPQGRTFRGVLFRLTSDEYDTRGALTVSRDLPILEQISQVCFDEGIGGVTHLDNTDKSHVEAVLRTNEVVSALTLEITVVVSNRIIDGQFISEYYWSSFQLASHDPDATAAPTDFRFPTLSPTTSLKPSPAPVTTLPTPQPSLNMAATFPPTFPPTTASPTMEGGSLNPTSSDVASLGSLSLPLILAITVAINLVGQ